MAQWMWMGMIPSWLRTVRRASQASFSQIVMNSNCRQLHKGQPAAIIADEEPHLVTWLAAERRRAAAELPGFAEQLQRALAIAAPFQELAVPGVGVTAGLGGVGVVEQLSRALEVFLSARKILLRLIHVRLRQQRLGMLDSLVQRARKFQ